MNIHLVRKLKTPACSTQSGAALIVSLVVLGIISVIGVSSMQTTNMQLKMATYDRDRTESFALAEAALIMVEEELSNSLQPSEENLRDDCPEATTFCFKDDCSGTDDFPGLCFDGSWAVGDSEIECSIGESAAAGERIKYWSDETLDVWNTDERHALMNIPGFADDVKYIVEFLCFADADPFDADKFGDGADDNVNAGEPLFRITVLAEAARGIAPVMLQTTNIAKCNGCKTEAVNGAP